MNKVVLLITLLVFMLGCQEEKKKSVPVSKHDYGEILSSFFSSGKTSCETIPQEYSKAPHDFDEASLLYLEATCHSIVAEIDEDANLVILKKAFKLEPNDKQGVELYAELSYSNESNAEIVKIHKHAIELSPENFKLFHQLALTYEDMNKLEEAIEIYQKGIKLAESKNNDVELLDFHYELGELYQDDDEFDKALEHYKNALSLKVDQPARLFNLTGMVYDDLDDYENAIAMYKKTIALDKTYVCAYSNMGYTYIQQNKLTDAKEVLKKSLKADPGSNCGGMAYYNLGVVYRKEGDCETALETFHLAIKNDVYDSGQDTENGINYNIGRCNVRLNKPDEAIKYLLKDTDLSEKSFWFLASAYIAKKDYPNAKKYISRAVEEDNDSDFLSELKDDEKSAKAYAFLAEVYLKKRRFGKAETYHKIATQKDPEAALSFARLALFALKDENLNKSEQLYQKAISIEPENIDFSRQLFLVYLKNNHCSAAKLLIDKLSDHKDIQKYQKKLSECSEPKS